MLNILLAKYSKLCYLLAHRLNQQSEGRMEDYKHRSATFELDQEEALEGVIAWVCLAVLLLLLGAL